MGKQSKLSALILFVALSSCVRNYKIPKEDYSLLPYTGKEILVFRSSKGDTDTIFLQGKSTFSSWTSTWDVFPKNAEHCIILAKSSDPSPPNGKQRYLDSLNFITLLNDGETKIQIKFTAKDAWFYCDSVYTKQTLTNTKNITLNIKGTSYKDVIILTPNKNVQEKYNGTYSDRPNTIYKLYWSRKDGIIRYDKKDEYWELIKKYKLN